MPDAPTPSLNADTLNDSLGRSATHVPSAPEVSTWEGSEALSPCRSRIQTSTRAPGTGSQRRSTTTNVVAFAAAGAAPCAPPVAPACGAAPSSDVTGRSTPGAPSPAPLAGAGRSFVVAGSGVSSGASAGALAGARGGACSRVAASHASTPARPATQSASAPSCLPRLIAPMMTWAAPRSLRQVDDLLPDHAGPGDE